MAFQQSVNTVQPFGLVGSFYDDSARRVAPYVLNAATGGTAATIGYAFTQGATPDQAVCGGEGAFLGILVSPHEYVLNGLNPSLELADGTIGQLCTFGHVIVLPTTETKVGYVAAYNNTTGAIEGYATADDVAAGSTLIPNSKFIFTDNAANTPSVLELGN